MYVSVEVFGQLAKDVQRLQTLDLEGPMCAQDVVTMLGLKPEEIGLITINGLQSELEDSLLPDCRLCLFPYLSGG
jgi:hypothetical protein